MTINELIEALSAYPGEFEVYLEVPEIDTWVPKGLDVDEEEKCVFILFED